MGKKAKNLGPLAVQRLTKLGYTAVGGVNGLNLQITSPKARSWVKRAVIGGKRVEIGLGPYPEVSLASARELAGAINLKIKAGIDPLAEARAARSALRASVAAGITFKLAATQYIEAHEAGWRNSKHAQQWRNTLETYAEPFIGTVLVRDVALPQVLAVLEPIWRDKTETASRLRGRIESILDWATARGYREGLNPARWRGHLDTILPAPAKLAKLEHHAALPVSELGAFMRDLRKQEGMGARALEFAILTAARSGEVRFATWKEIDKAAAVWKVPGDRMKAGKEHRVPLSPAALALLRALPRTTGVELVFPAPRGGALSDMTLTAVLRRMGVDAVPHGFRSTFRDWCAERTNYPREVAEMALAHSIGDKVEAAYRRGDLLEKRKSLMNEWATFCTKAEPQRGDVIPIERGTRRNRQRR